MVGESACWAAKNENQRQPPWAPACWTCALTPTPAALMSAWLPPHRPAVGTTSNSAGWWFKPDFIINELNINSAVSRPWHDEVLPLGTNGVYTMNGYAYTGVFGEKGRTGRVTAAAAALPRHNAGTATAIAASCQHPQAAVHSAPLSALHGPCNPLLPCLTLPPACLCVYAALYQTQVVAARSSALRCPLMVATCGGRQRSHATRHQHLQVSSEQQGTHTHAHAHAQPTSMTGMTVLHTWLDSAHTAGARLAATDRPAL